MWVWHKLNIHTAGTSSQSLSREAQQGRRVIYRQLFSLKTMLEFPSQAVEQHLPAITTIYLPTLE
ncbi:hypothetical protein [Trichocoleus desertorum]|uniref:hypothetical protein n=1 Tax=Trichocoleus desertorum TaxID=1481672 RepID=UPI003298336B